MFFLYIPDIGLMVTMFANGPGDLGSIPSRVIPKTQNMVLDATLLNTQHYKVRIEVNWSNLGKGVANLTNIYIYSENIENNCTIFVIV